MSVGRRSILPWIYGGSLAAHVAFGAVSALLPTPERTKDIAIELADIKKKKEPPKAPPVPPPPPPEDKPKPPPPRPVVTQAKMAQEPAKMESAPPPEVGADGFANLEGVSLASGEGVPVGGPATGSETAAARALSAPKATAHRVEQLAVTAQNACTEAVVKPKRKRIGPVKYTKQAQEAEIEGVVRVQVIIDEQGKVISAHVMSGLGYGLDEIALAAANDSEFEPATLCGKPLVATKVLAISFELR